MHQMGWPVARTGVGNVLGKLNVNKLKSIGEYSEHNLILLQRDRDRGELMLDTAVRSEHRSGASPRTIRHGTILVVVVDLTRAAAHVVPLRSMLAYLRAYLQCQPGERTSGG